MVCDLHLLYGLLNILPVLHDSESLLEHPLSPQHCSWAVLTFIRLTLNFKQIQGASEAGGEMNSLLDISIFLPLSMYIWFKEWELSVLLCNIAFYSVGKKRYVVICKKICINKFPQVNISQEINKLFFLLAWLLFCHFFAGLMGSMAKCSLRLYQLVYSHRFCPAIFIVTTI